MKIECRKLVNGLEIPVVGLGTGWMNPALKSGKYRLRRRVHELKQRIKGKYSKENNYTLSYELRKLHGFEKSITDADKIGYTLYDTAYSYNNCELMGRALGADKRENLFIISKCSNKAQREDKVVEEFEKTLKALDTSYLDLYLIHWPQTDTFIDAWKVLEALYHEGRVKAIGVSNFHVHHIEELISKCEITPMVNEIECHPLLQQKNIRDFCRASGIQLIAHTSTGKMRSGIRNSVLKSIAESHNKTIAQIILRWHFQLGDVSIVNSLNPEHMKENISIFDFELSEEEMRMIADMDSGLRIWPDPDNCDFTKL